MAGLLFAINETPGEADRLVGRSVSRMLHFPWLKSRRFASGQFAAACVLPDSIAPPLWYADGEGGFAAVFGEYYPHDDALTDEGAAFDEIRRLCAQGRGAELKNRNGLYNLVYWDSRRRELLVANDTTGALLLFQARVPGGEIWCSEPGILYELPEVRSGVDYEAVASLVGIGYQPDNRTVRTGVTVFPPATVLRVRLTRSSTEEQRESGDPLMSQEICADYETEFPICLREAVRLRVHGELPVQLPLSGGEDSRLLLASVLDLGVNVSTWTLDGCQIGDAAAACRVAARARVAHSIVGLDSRGIVEARPFLSAAFASTMDWHAGAFLGLLKRLGPGGLIPLGFLGGTFAGAFIKARSEDGMHERLRETLRAAFDVDTGISSTRSGLVPAALATGRDAESGGTSRPSSATTGVCPEILENLYGRQRKYTSHLVRLAWNFGKPVCPFADRRLIRLGLSLTRRDLHLLHARRRVFSRQFPRLAGIVNGNDGLPVNSFALRRLRNRVRGTSWSALGRRLLRLTTPNYDLSRLRPLLSEAVQSLPEEQRRLMATLTARATILEALALLPLVVCHTEAIDLAAWHSKRGG